MTQVMCIVDIWDQDSRKNRERQRPQWWRGRPQLSGCKVPNRYPNQQPKEELLRLDPSLHEAGADPVDRTEESKCDFTV